MKKQQFIVIPFDNTEDYCIVDDVKELIEDLFGKYTDETENSFYDLHKVFKIKGKIKEMN